MSTAPDNFQDRLRYRFANAALLDQALTHRSFGVPHNERLEFLGDGVLGCVIAEALYAKFPGLAEGRLTPLRAGLVREETLADIALELGLDRSVRLGEGERAAGVRPSILADAMEAVFGAVFLDGGYPAARDTIVGVYADRLAELDPERTAKDPKTRLQEALQARHLMRPEYRVTAVRGEAHRQTFEVECVVPQLGLQGVGAGTSRRRAEQAAAAAVLGSIER